ncbi:hypothetical protein ACGC1H_003067 [Rhizoctonia solani]|uniref:Zn(2)-C6 fungal-type domain-containing protein n=1 Tax=Rhizoctonia solani TaxID=456999 RepID=A0A8H3C9R0_9AGAM|nr:unnamed protein product [Rhizoctonia solani]
MPETRSDKGLGFQRSKKGCLTCRRKRKKCDEQPPVCSRCEKSDSECIWPQHSAHPITPTFGTPLDGHVQEIMGASVPPTSFGINRTADSNYPYNDPLSPYNDPLSQSMSLFPFGIMPTTIDIGLGDLNTTGGLDSRFTFSSNFDRAGFWQSVSTPNNITSPTPRSPLVSAHSKQLTLKSWEYAQDYGPQVIWPPNDSDESHSFDPEGAMPTLHRSIDILTQTVVIDPVFQEIFYFWSTFLSRIFYNYATVPESIAGWMLQRFKVSDSAKYGMLATAVLFRANYERSPLTDSLRNHAKELYSLASRQVSLELKNEELLPQVKLVGLIEVTNYEYYSSNLSRYYPHVLEAASIVRQIMGSDTLDLLSLTGNHTFDIRCFAWCDILHSMATSRPTMLKYEFNIEQAQHSGSEDGYTHTNKGVEWIYGCPDVLTVILARTSSIKHSPASKENKIRHGVMLEELVLNWEFRPAQAKGSVMRVARVGVQEVWRHIAILYIHQAIFQSPSTHPTVRSSVRSIIRIASTLKPGVNPDCFLSVPYFIAGSFAVSQKDRYILKSRVLNCGNEPFLRNLASSLEDIWAESDATGRFASWSDKEPPTVVF